MTGFGRASTSSQPAFEVEVRSVNHRFLKVNQKLPAAFAHLEGRVEALIRKQLSRGSVHVQARMVSAEEAEGPRLCPEVVERHYRDLRALHARLGMKPDKKDARLLRLAVGMPGSVRESRPLPEESERGEARFLEAITEGLAALHEARRQEGAHLVGLLGEHLDAMTELMAKAREVAAQIPGRHRDRLIERVRGLMPELGGQPPISERDLAREIALLAERLDVTEELGRLAGHTERFRAILAQDGPVGRELDFLLQEMNREANTLGSKAQDEELSHLGVALKVEIERLREQVQNVE